MESNFAYAQEKYYGDGYIGIRNSNSFWAGGGETGYEFTIDTQGFGAGFKGPYQVTSLVIQTNAGDITFENGFDGSEATRYVTGLLFSEDDLTVINITKAIAVINGKMLDITGAINPEEFVPVRIIGKPN
jgi:hypothetical protein